MKSRGPDPKFNAEKLKAKWESYKEWRLEQRLPYTLESLWVFLEISKPCWYKYADEKRRPDLQPVIDNIYNEIVSSLVDHALIEKCNIAKWLITCRDKKTYGDQQNVSLDGELNITFKRADANE